MNWTVMLFLLIFGYIAFDLYRSKDRLTLHGKPQEWWNDMREAKWYIWTGGFLGFLTIMFLVRGIVILEYEAQECTIIETGVYRSEPILSMDLSGIKIVQNMTRINDTNIEDKGFEERLIVQNKSWNYYRRVVIDENGGKLPVGLNITCAYDFEGTGKRIMEDYKSR